MDSYEEDSLSLDGLEVTLPAAEEQAIRRDKAFSNLQTYVELCGGTLPEGWGCALRFRITSRRRGRQGVTTDNFYYSPCGKTLRTHKQVAQCLGLQPLTKDQMKQQQFRSDDLAPVPEQFSIVSFTLLDSVSGAAASASSKPGKRSHSAMAATDTAAGSPVCSPVQQHQPACSAPAALAGSTPQAVSCSLEAAHQLCCSSGLPAAPAVQQPAAKRTKAALAAKYNSTASCNFASPSSAAATAMGAAAAASSVVSCQTSCEGSGAVCSQSGLAAAAATGREDQTQQPLPQHLAPAQPAASSTSPSRASSSKAVSSRLVVPAAAQQQRRVVQPVPKPWKPRAQPAWRAKLRELATAAVLAEELSAAAASADTHTS